MSFPVYSIIVPVYNRPQEVDELLQSLTYQTYTNFEVVIVEDGSTLSSEEVVKKYTGQLSIQYVVKPNTGPGPSRNVGFDKANGEYLVVFDSDCIIPEHYLMAVEKFLSQNNVDAWGGPDRGHSDFTLLQQAMGYTMSSFLTTGGIRGGKKSVGWFQPRSFNMGMRRSVFEKTRGFVFDRYAEDIELSIRMKKMGFKTALIPDAYVYHKRRTTFGQFFKQVSNFGKGRVLVGKAHRGEVKMTHWFPTLFLLGLVITPLLVVFAPALGKLALAGYVLYFVAIAIDAFAQTKSPAVAVLSIPSAFIQLTGYGWGFLKEYGGAKKG